METASELEQLLLSHFTTEDQQVFVKNFQDYLKYGMDDSQFIVDFNDVYLWLGFTQKHHAKRLLVKKFNDGVDYVIKKALTPEGERFVPQNGGQNKEKIMLTVPTFKSFSMYCETDKGKQTRQYYATMEKIFFQYIQNNHNKVVEKITKEAKDSHEKQHHETLVRAYEKTPCIYLAKLYDDDKIIKIGESKDISERITTLKNEYKVDNVILLECIPCPDPYNYEQSLIKRHQIITPRRICDTELVKLDEVLTLQKLIDIIRRGKAEYIDKHLKREEIIAKKETALSEERLYIYKQIANARDDNERKCWESKLEDLKQVPCSQPESLPSTSSAPPVHSIRRVFKYNPEDLSNPVAEYISLKEAARSLNNNKLHDYHIREACLENTLFEGHRWYFVDNEGDKPETIPSTCEQKQKPTKRLGLVARLSGKPDASSTKITQIYTSQREAAKSVKVADCSLTVALSNNTCCAKSYWKMYEDCSAELKATFEGVVPEYVPPETCNKKVERLHPTTGEVLETLSSLQEACSKFKTCHKTLKKKSDTEKEYKGYKWRVY
jgi:phage anti-repressor protein